jgi:nucleoside-diphosphate-sugar epimerase
MPGDLVLVTGGSGFVGAHCIVALLNAGYRVRTTVRSLARKPDVLKMLQAGGITSVPAGRVEFVEADLEEDFGWAEAVAGCRYVLHVASPFPAEAPKHEDELIVPARDGALRVLRAARDAGVERVVLTSSFAAIGYGHGSSSRPSTEADWTDATSPTTSAYAKSKTLAEKAAWDFIKKEGGELQLATVNPVAILGPVLGPDRSTSIQLVQRLIDGDIPGCPQLSYGIVDVRDVADLHLRAMVDPVAAGERFLAVAGPFASMSDIAKILKANLGRQGERVPTRVLPNFVVRGAARFDPSLRQLVSELGKQKAASGEKARRMLGWKPRTNDEAILATARSLIALGLTKV